MISNLGSGSLIVQRLLSRPLKVSWAGWESDTHRLQQAGWQVSAEEDLCTMQMRLALQNREWGCQALSMINAHRYIDDPMLNRYDDHPEAHFGMRMGKEVHIHENSPMGTPGFHPVDCTPQWEQRRITKLADWAHFAVPLTRTQEIILPQEEDVNALLERILEKQQGARRRYFEEQVREGQYQEVPTMHAQIITLRQAA